MREHYGLFSRRGSNACNKPGTDMNKIQFLLLSLLLTLPVTAMAQSTIKGDVNGDGTVNITDLNAVINMIIDDSATMIADVNGDGTVNTADIIALKKYLLLVKDAKVVNGDINKDGTINTMDMVRLVNKLLS